MYIGKRIRALRKRADMSLVELAEKTGIQIATLSRIENEKMVGTLQSHVQIAKVLNVEVTELYTSMTPQTKTGPSPEDENEADIFVDSDQASYELLTHQVLHKKMMPTMVKIEGNGQTTQEQQPAGAEKFVFVVDGRIEVNVAGKAYPLSEGNTLYFKASTTHYFKNLGKSPARVLTVLTPVTF